MNSLDLDIKHRVAINIDAKLLLDSLGKPLLICKLRLTELALHVGVLDKLLKTPAQVIIGDPLIRFQPARDDLGQSGIGVLHPPSRSDAVRHIEEFVRVLLVEIWEQPGLDEAGVNRSYTIDLVRSNNSENCHTNHLGVALLDDAHARQLVAVAWELLRDRLQMATVDLVDDLHVPRQETLHQRDGPLLQSLRQDRVVGVGEDLGGCRPRCAPAHSFRVHEQAHELGNADSGMCIVQLDGNLRVQLCERPVLLLEATDDVLKRC
mmetsp:Transcript_8293/g.24906  ORF Transcript_8293/g.24906 Transcript_8293/m.24906 type:complete len:264 (+) Transcript_8293:581-1372(+)